MVFDKNKILIQKFWWFRVFRTNIVQVLNIYLINGLINIQVCKMYISSKSFGEKKILFKKKKKKLTVRFGPVSAYLGRWHFMAAVLPRDTLTRWASGRSWCPLWPLWPLVPAERPSFTWVHGLPEIQFKENNFFENNKRLNWTTSTIKIYWSNRNNIIEYHCRVILLYTAKCFLTILPFPKLHVKYKPISKSNGLNQSQ